MSKFQVELSGKWEDYRDDEQNYLMQAYLSGFQKCFFEDRGQKYEYDFVAMEQKNLDSGKTRRMRPPYKLQRPQQEVVPPGRQMVVICPEGSVPGMQMGFPHPDNPAVTLAVTIPDGSVPGSQLLVPVPDLQDQQVVVQNGMANAYGMNMGCAPVAPPPAMAPQYANGPMMMQNGYQQINLQRGDGDRMVTLNQ